MNPNQEAGRLDKRIGSISDNFVDILQSLKSMGLADSKINVVSKKPINQHKNTVQKKASSRTVPFKRQRNKTKAKNTGTKIIKLSSKEEYKQKPIQPESPVLSTKTRTNKQKKSSKDNSKELETSEQVKELKNVLKAREWTREWILNCLIEKDTSKGLKFVPRYGEIPLLNNTSEIVRRLSELKVFKEATSIKVGPSVNLRGLRQQALKEGKALYSNVSDQGLDLYRIKSETSWGATQKSLVNFRSSPPLINMYVVDSLAVSTAGIRLDVGNGETDFEWGLLYELGAVNKDTVVVTLVSDFQLTDESCLSGWMKKSNDLPVDIIVTPSRVHQIDTKYEKPKEGILLTILSKDKLKKLPSNYCIGPKPSSPQNSHTKTFARERCYD